MMADGQGPRPSQSLELVACARSASAVLGKGAVPGLIADVGVVVVELQHSVGQEGLIFRAS